MKVSDQIFIARVTLDLLRNVNEITLLLLNATKPNWQ